MAETDSVTSAASHLRKGNYMDTTSFSSNDGRSFTSPYTVQTLDQIPTPILKMLVVLGPFIHYCADIIQVITWATPDSRQSILALLLWIGLCLWTAPVLTFVLPTLIIVQLAKGWLKVKTLRARRERLEKERQIQRMKQQQQDAKNNDNDYYDDDDRRRHKQQQEEEEEQLLISRKFQPEGHVSLDDTLVHLAIVNAYVDRVREWIHWIRDEILDGSRPDVVASTLTMLLYAWPVWIIFNWVLGTHGIFALVGSFLLVHSSPWFKVIVMAMRRNVLITHAIAACWAYGVALVISMVSIVVPFRVPATNDNISSNGSQFKSWIKRLTKRVRREKSKAMDVIKSENQVEEKNTLDGLRTEMIFQFDIYENQRWWLGMDWTTNMMPSERAPWTDNQLAPVQSKEGFELPPSSETVQYRPIIGGDGVAIKQTTKKVWSWADGDWWVDMTGEIQGRVDRNGWEYGNNAWKQLTGHPAMQTFTRRRRWSRRARLVERRFEKPVHEMDDNSNSITSTPTTTITATESVGLRKRS